MGYLPRVAANKEWNQPKRKKCVVVNKAERSWRSEEHFGNRHGDGGLGVCPAGFQSCFGSASPHSSHLCFGMVMYTCAVVCWKYVICFFILNLQVLQLRDCHESLKRRCTF